MIMLAVPELLVLLTISALVGCALGVGLFTIIHKDK